MKLLKGDSFPIFLVSDGVLKPANIRRSSIPERFRPFPGRLPPQHVKLMTQNGVFSLQARPATGTLRPTPTKLGYKLSPIRQEHRPI